MGEFYKIQLLHGTVPNFCKRVTREYWKHKKMHTYEALVVKLKETYRTLTTKSTIRQNCIDLIVQYV